MARTILLALAAYYALTAAWLILWPLSFYRTIPGVAETGPLNLHFARDVGFAFLVTGAGLGLGALLRDRRLALIGAAFPVLHGLFHLVGLGHHSFATTDALVQDIVTTAGAAAVALVAALQLKGDAA